MGARHWIETDAFERISKRLNLLLHEDKNFDGYTLSYGPITCERLLCRIGEYDVCLNRFYGQPHTMFVGSDKPESAFMERTFSGKMAIAVIRATSKRLHDMMVVADTGTCFWVRRGARVTMRLLEPEAHSLIIASCPPRFRNLPPLDPKKYAHVLRPFRDYYHGIDSNSMC